MIHLYSQTHSPFLHLAVCPGGLIPIDTLIGGSLWVKARVRRRGRARVYLQPSPFPAAAASILPGSPLHTHLSANNHSPTPPLQALLLVFSHLVVSDSLQPQGLQHARLPCPSPTPGACSNSCPSNRRCHPTISSSVVPFSSCPQSFPASGSSLMSRLFTFRPKEANSPIPTPPPAPGACIIPLCSS